METIILPIGDNYCYVLLDQQSACVIDAVQAGPIKELLAKRNLTLHAVLSTHSHSDHVNGNHSLRETFDCPVIAGSPTTPGVTRLVRERDTIAFGGTRIQVMATPGHTQDSLCYYIAGNPGSVFTGDTLFQAGCGRLLDGTAEELWRSLAKLSALPEETLVFCGHEYLRDNLAFLASLFPWQPGLADLQNNVKAVNIPSTIGWEKTNNPFMRARSAIELAAIRRQKDLF